MKKINKTILITGGTGSFGSAYVKFLLKNYNYKKIIIFSRDELKQSEMINQKEFRGKKNLRFFLGDVRDRSRLNLAFKDVNYIVHAAALKQVPAAEYNPIEFVKTNITGSQNIIEAALNNSVEKVVSLSTDKAVSPANLYGATKLCADKLFVAANNLSGKQKIRFAIVRYGNVIASRGSVIPIFLDQKKNNNNFTITDSRMTRFSISMLEAIKMVDWSLKNCLGGEIIVPKISSYKILDIAKAIDPKRRIKFIGLRAGEKIHEELISDNETDYLYDYGKYFAIVTPLVFENAKKVFLKKKKIKIKKIYNSGNNKFLTINQIKKIINKI